MKRNLQKTLITIACLLCSIGVYAHDFEVDGIYYKIRSSDEVEVTYRGIYPTDYGNEYTGTIVIPESVTYQSVDYSVTSIGESVFYRCTGLKEVTIGNSVTLIGSLAFYGCTGLTEVTIGNSVSEIGQSVFYECTAMAQINCLATTPPTIDSSTFDSYSASLVVPVESISAYKSADYWKNFTSINKYLVDGLYYNIISVNDVELTQVAYSKDVIVIPESIKINGVTYKVTSIGDNAFAGCTEIKEVAIPNSVTSIGSSAFNGCTGLTSVTIPNSVTSIGGSAFYYCKGLKEIIIPNSVTSIGEVAFEGCTGLTEVTIPNSVTSIYGGTFYRCTGLTSVTIPNSVTSIYGGAFYGCTGLTEITIPNSVTSIGEWAFEDCTGLTTVNFNAENCTTMGSSYYPVFSGCSNLTAVNIGESVKTIPDYAFSNCTGLTQVTIPNRVTSIGEKAFSGCTGLTTVNFNTENCTTMGLDAFTGCSNLTTLNIGESVKTIPDYAFSSCAGLTTVNFNAENCTTVGSSSSSAFYDCRNLKILNIGESVKIIPDNAFNRHTNLNVYCLPIVPPNISSTTFKSDAIINLSFESLSKYVVADIWKALQLRGVDNGITYYLTSTTTLEVVAGDTHYSGEVIIPESITHTEGVYTITSIGGSAFSGCTGLKEVTIGNSVTSIGDSAFKGCTSLTTVNFNAENCTTMGSYSYPVFKGCNNLKTLNIGESVKAIPNYAFNGCTGLTEVTIPNSVTSIGDDAFRNCSGLTSVTIGNSVTEIGNGAFSHCTGLTQVTIGNSVTSIGHNAFYECTGLTEVTIPNSVSSIGERAFRECARLTSVSIPNSVTSICDYAFSGCTGLTEVTIPNSVTSIGSSAFAGCTGLTQVTIGNSVTSIGYNAFYECTGLTTVNFNAENCTTMGSDLSPVFEDCSNLKTLNIGESVKIIPENAFRDCTELTDVIVPNNVTSIGNSAFKGCTSLKSLTIEDGDSKLNLGFNYYSSSAIGEGLFYDCPIETLYLGRNLSYDTSYHYGYSPFYNIKELNTITIGNSVTSIGNSAFAGCSSMKSLTIEDGNSELDLGYNYYSSSYKGEGLFCDCPIEVLYLGRNLSYNTGYSYGYSPFYNIEKLKSVTIGNSVTLIGEYAFSDCTGLTEINCLVATPPTIYSSTFSSYSASLVVPVEGISAYKSADYWKNFTSINKYLVDGLYYNIISVNNVEVTQGAYSVDVILIPESVKINGVTYKVTSIGDNAFAGCTEIKEVAIPNSVTSIGSSAFNGCTGLTSVTIPNSVTSIGGSAFYYCKGLKEIIIPNSVTSIGEGAFYACSSLTEVTIPNSVTSINISAFRGCTGLIEINIPNSVTSIGSSAFYGCTDLTEVNIPNSVTEIGNGAFRDCTGLTEVTIPNSVTSIGGSAFSDCESLRTVTIGSAVTEIGEKAFDGCDRIKTVNSYAEVPPTINSNTFSVYVNDNATLHVVKRCKEAYADAKYWEYFVNITDDLRSVNYVDPEQLQLDKEKITAYVGNTIEVLATLSPDNVTEKCVTWSVSDSTILEITKVNDLSIEVLVLKEGVANIVATSVDGSNLTATCEVTVESTLATSITLDQSAVTLKAAETATLTATVLPETTTDKGVEWSSSDNEVASVENGVVTAHKVGTATITATTTDGSNLSATCEVTVEATLATSITLDQTNITAMEGETVVLTATIYPDDATEKGVVWSVSDATIATIEPLDNLSAKITVLKKGIATITAETIDGSNLSATCTIDVYSDIEALLRDSEDVEYYDLNGFRVENPTRGIYIVKHGDIVRKVFVNKAR